jgi:hypothetical protein
LQKEVSQQAQPLPYDNVQQREEKQQPSHGEENSQLKLLYSDQSSPSISSTPSKAHDLSAAPAAASVHPASGTVSGFVVTNEGTSWVEVFLIRCYLPFLTSSVQLPSSVANFVFCCGLASPTPQQQGLEKGRQQEKGQQQQGGEQKQGQQQHDQQQQLGDRVGVIRVRLAAWILLLISSIVVVMATRSASKYTAAVVVFPTATVFIDSCDKIGPCFKDRLMARLCV